MGPTLKAGLSAASVAFVAFGLAGCADLPSSGPTTAAVLDAGASDPVIRPYEVIDIDPSTIDVLGRRPKSSFAARFGDHRPSLEPVIGVGDMISVTIWEASSGGLFSSPAALEQLSARRQQRDHPRAGRRPRRLDLGALCRARRGRRAARRAPCRG